MPDQPIVIAHHLIWSAYGTWLPNDPRGSGSSEISSRLLAELGELHQGRKKVQPAGRVIREFYGEAAPRLLFPAPKFDAAAIAIIGKAFGNVVETQSYTCYAGVVMPDHVHLLIRKHKHTAEEMIHHLREGSRELLIAASLRTTDHPVWCGGSGWKIFLDHPDEIRRTIKYIDDNPIPWRLPRQSWPFVKPYDGWPLHPGHSPNSPYVKRLRAAGRL